MKKKLPYATIIVCTVIVVLYFAIYTVLTPFIRGRVIDAQTGKPVEDAWVIAIAGIDTRTIAGDVSSSYAISRHHLRTGKDGTFTIFPKMYFSIPTPFSFGNKSRELKITVHVKDGKRAETDLTKSWWKRILIVTVPVKHEVRDGREVSKELSSLTTYCIHGKSIPGYRYSNESCDSWELEYVLREYEVFIQQMKENKSNKNMETNLWLAYQQIALLYKMKGDYPSAISIYEHLKKTDEEKGSTMWIKEYNDEIDDLRILMKNR